jgi:F0F1-type ATP synthase delta subunit
VAAEICRRSGLSKLAGDFLALIAEGRRTNHLRVIAEKYEKLLDVDLGRVRAQCAVRSRSRTTSGSG